MKTFKVTDEKGIHHGDNFLKKGKVFKSPNTAQTRAWLRFKQIEETPEEESDEEEEETPEEEVKSGKGKNKPKDETSLV